MSKTYNKKAHAEARENLAEIDYELQELRHTRKLAQEKISYWESLELAERDARDARVQTVRKKTGYLLNYRAW